MPAALGSHFEVGFAILNTPVSNTEHTLEFPWNINNEAQQRIDRCKLLSIIIAFRQRRRKSESLFVSEYKPCDYV
jgi:hypothetical protein